MRKLTTIIFIFISISVFAQSKKEIIAMQEAKIDSLQNELSKKSKVIQETSVKITDLNKEMWSSTTSISGSRYAYHWYLSYYAPSVRNISYVAKTKWMSVRCVKD